MAVSFLAVAAWRRDRRPLVLGLIIAAAGLMSRVIDSRLARSLFEGSQPGLPASGGSASGNGGANYVDDRLTAFVTTWLRPGYGRVGGPQLLAVLVLITGVAAVVLLRRGERPAVVSAIGVGLAVMVIWRVVGRSPVPDVVPGLLVAFPLFAWGIAGLTRRLLSAPAVAWCAGSFVLFAAAVAATQYREGGAWEWGGRYFAAGLPLAIPLVVLGGRETMRRFDDLARRVVTVVVVVIAVSCAVLQVLAVRDSHVLSHRLVDHVLEVARETPAGDGGRPVILSTEAEMPRTAWRELDRARWLYVPVGDLDEAMSRLGAAGIDAVVVATLAGPDAAVALPQMADARDGDVPPEGVWWFESVEVR
jgi:hypothetical protein